MDIPVNEKIEAACRSKARFPDLRVAWERADASGASNVKPYLCPKCGGYHLTSRTTYYNTTDRITDRDAK